MLLGNIIGLPSEDYAQNNVPFPTPASQRIVSLAPSITETLFALGIGGQVVGGTDDCFFPSEVKNIPKIGNYYRPNIEAIVRLRPDLVILLTQHLILEQGLSHLGIRTLSVDHDRVDGILSGIINIGNTCKRHEAAEKLVTDLKTRIEQVKTTTRNLPRPRVMVTIGRNMGSEGLGNIYQDYRSLDIGNDLVRKQHKTEETCAMLP